MPGQEIGAGSRAICSEADVGRTPRDLAATACRIGRQMARTRLPRRAAALRRPAPASTATRRRGRERARKAHRSPEAPQAQLSVVMGRWRILDGPNQNLATWVDGELWVARIENVDDPAQQKLVSVVLSRAALAAQDVPDEVARARGDARPDRDRAVPRRGRPAARHPRRGRRGHAQLRLPHVAGPASAQSSRQRLTSQESPVPGAWKSG